MFWSSINKCVDMKGETKTETETKLVWQIGSPHFSNIKKIYIYIYIMAINNDNNDDSNVS